MDMVQDLNACRNGTIVEAKKLFFLLTEEQNEECTLVLNEEAALTRQAEILRRETESLQVNKEDLVRTQAQITDGEKHLNKQIETFESEKLETEKVTAIVKQKIVKSKESLVKITQDKENNRSRVRMEASLCQDMTGICWDYQHINGDQLVGYVRNKSMNRIKTINEDTSTNHSQKITDYLWDLIAEVSNAK